MAAHDSQTFFTPDKFFCMQSRLSSKTYNLAYTLLHRSQQSHIFIAIRSLQYLAIIEKNAFWFVDSLAYAVKGNEGGRLIRVSWHPILPSSQRTSLNENMDCRVYFYAEDMMPIQNRLNHELYQSMMLLDQKYRDALDHQTEINILPLNPTTTDSVSE